MRDSDIATRGTMTNRRRMVTVSASSEALSQHFKQVAGSPRPRCLLQRAGSRNKSASGKLVQYLLLLLLLLGLLLLVQKIIRPKP